MALRPIEVLIRAKDEFSGMLGSMQAKVAAVAVAIAGFFGISLFSGAVKSAAEFESAMSRVKSAAGGTDEEFKALKQAAEDAGAATKYTSVQAAEALENLAKAGLNATQAIEALPAVLALAQAGDVELGTSAEFVTKAVMGMGLAFADAGRVADVLALGAGATNTSVKGLAEALSYAAPTAQSLGLSLETTVAIIGKFADAGIDASRAGTALNSIMSQFADPASKFRNELAAVGITTGDFNQALHELAASGTRGSKAINAVGLEAGPALKALLNQGMPALDALKAKLDDAAGSAAETAKVMGDNLDGALNGLASSWDTIKTVLGTPVLPVLKDGVDQLAGALRGLVADGTIAKFGESFAEAFRAAIKWARDFFDQIDFKAVVADLQAFAAQAGDTFRSIGENAAMAGNAAQTAYGVMSAGVNAVLAAVYGIGSAFAGVASNIQSGLALLYDAFAKITFGDVSAAYKLAADEIRLSAEATWAASEALGEKSKAAFLKVADGAQIARDGFAKFAGAAADAAPAADNSSKAIAEMARQIEDAGQKTVTANKATQEKTAADKAAAQAADENRAAIAQLRAEYATLVASGNWQAAAQKMEQINTALRNTPAAAGDAGKAAEEAAAQISAAFDRLGVTSSAALQQQAQNAIRDYDTIKNSGTASARDVGLAFKAAADKAIAANNGIAPSWVAAQAGARGYQVAVDAAGQATLSAMGAAGGAIGTAITAHNQAIGAAGAHATSVDGVARAYGGAGAAANSAASSFAAANAAAGGGTKTAAEQYKEGFDKAKAQAEKTNNRKAGDTGGDGTIIPVFETMAELDTYVERWKADFREDNREFIGSTEYIWYQRMMDQAHKKAAQALKSREAVKEAGRKAAEEKAKAEKAEERPLPAPTPSPQKSSSGAAPTLIPSPAAPAKSAGGGNTYISNITLPSGRKETVRFADAQSQSVSERLLRDLAAGKGVAQ